VTAESDSKGKMSPAKAKIVSVEKAPGGGYLVHLSVSLKKHRQTLIHLN